VSVVFVMLATDLVKFMKVYLVFLISFGTAFTVLDEYAYNTASIPNSDLGEIVPGVSAIDRLKAILLNFQTLSIGVLSGNFAQLDEHYLPPRMIWLFVLLTLAFITLSALLLFNILIALMGYTFHVLDAKAKLLHVRELMNITLWIEKGWSEHSRSEWRKRYIVEIDNDSFDFPYGPYIEVIADSRNK
jgi:hypothetical protein